MKRRDLLVIFLVLVTALMLFGVSRWMAGDAPGDRFIVSVDGKEVLSGTLSQTGAYPIDQEDGSHNLLLIQNGYIMMQEANCRDGLCVKQGRTNTAAKTIVCLPHRLTVSVLRSNPGAAPSDDLDIVIQ